MPTLCVARCLSLRWSVLVRTNPPSLSSASEPPSHSVISWLVTEGTTAPAHPFLTAPTYVRSSPPGLRRVELSPLQAGCTQNALSVEISVQPPRLLLASATRRHTKGASPLYLLSALRAASTRRTDVFWTSPSAPSWSSAARPAARGQRSPAARRGVQPAVEVTVTARPPIGHQDHRGRQAPPGEERPREDDRPRCQVGP